MGWAMMFAGLLLALTASALLVLNVIESGPASLLGILGIGLIATSGRWLNRAKSRAGQVVRTIYSPDRQLRALVKQRSETDFHIEVQKFIHEYSPDVGSHDRWERQSNVPASGSLTQVIDKAAAKVGAGSGDFY